MEEKIIVIYLKSGNSVTVAKDHGWLYIERQLDGNSKYIWFKCESSDETLHETGLRYVDCYLLKENIDYIERYN